MKVSIVVPTYNEADNVLPLLQLVNRAADGRDFEIIAVDDNSDDGTWERLFISQKYFPLKAFRKVGKRGKAYSLFEGFAKASGNAIVFIDGDLQYPPSNIFPMVDKLDGADVVVADRKVYKDTGSRRITSSIFRNVFGKVLHGLNHDVQSGLKAFRREVIETVWFKPKSAWTFDMEFLVRAKQAGFKITDHEIIFEGRRFGKSKINTLTSSLQIAVNALILKFKQIGPQVIYPTGPNMEGAGFGWRGKKYITHTTLHQKKSAIRNMYTWQKVFFFAFCLHFFFF